MNHRGCLPFLERQVVQAALQISLKKKLRSVNFFAKNCEAKEYFFSTKRSEAMIFLFCEKLRNCEIIFHFRIQSNSFFRQKEQFVTHFQIEI